MQSLLILQLTNTIVAHRPRSCEGFQKALTQMRLYQAWRRTKKQKDFVSNHVMCFFDVLVVI